jgi:hypothetical protein
VDFDAVTGGDGTVSTDFFGAYPAGTEFQVWVEDAAGAPQQHPEDHRL